MRLLRTISALLITMLFSCKDPKSSTLLDSANINNKNERIQTLNKHILLKSQIKECDFELINVNGFDNARVSVPGASSINYKFGLILNKEDIPIWTSGLIDTNFNHYDFNWVLKIIKKRPENWSLHFSSKFYTSSDGKINLVVYQSEGILFEWILND